MAVMWQHRLVYAVQMGRDILSWFNLPPVDGIRKNDDGTISVYLKNVVIYGLQRQGLSLVQVEDHNWLCRDEEQRWWVLSQANYCSLDAMHHVTLFPNEQTHRQAMAIMAIEKLKREFSTLPPEEQEELYNKYPELFIKEE